MLSSLEPGVELALHSRLTTHREHSMKKAVDGIAVFYLSCMAAMPVAAQTKELTACAVVSAADAERLVGGPLTQKAITKVKTADGPNTYNSVCTYVAKGVNFDNSAGAARLLDLTLHFLQSPAAARELHDTSIEQYREMVKDPEAPFKNATITPLDGFGDKAFVLEGMMDPKTKHKIALIVFTKGKVGGTVNAWNKPNASLVTAKAVLTHILSKLP